jgi:hypothetical protein
MRLHVLAALEATSVILGERAEVTSVSGPRTSVMGIIEVGRCRTDIMTDAARGTWAARN